MTLNFVADILTAPFLQVISVTPLSMRVNWSTINYDVDSWSVRLLVLENDEYVQDDGNSVSVWRANPTYYFYFVLFTRLLDEVTSKSLRLIICQQKC